MQDSGPLARSPSSRGATGSKKTQEGGSEEELFSTPPELVCPLTLSVFLEPVLTAAGHVYELSAINLHLQQSDIDPLTRQKLLNKSLTPVYVLKSRAHEYREQAAKACVERACSGGCADPDRLVRYLRRAVDLIAGTSSHVPGLSEEAVGYVLTHPSNAYDARALQTFAEGLYSAGYRDRAAAIYYALLTAEADRGQQAELLRRCIACWTPDPPPGTGRSTGRSAGGSGGGSSPTALAAAGAAAAGRGSVGSGAAAAAAAASPRGGSTALVAAGGGAASSPAAAAAEVDGFVLEKLIGLFDGHTAFTWPQLMDIALEAEVGVSFVERLCEQLLFRPMPSGRSGSGDDEVSSAATSGAAWRSEKEVLLKYVQVLTGGLKSRQTQLDRRLAELQGGSSVSGGSGAAGGAKQGGGSGGGGRPAAVLQAWLHHPAVVAVCMLVTVVGSREGHPAVRVVRAVPLLALLR